MISLKDFLILTKFKLSFTVSLSLVFSFILAKSSIDVTIIKPFLAVLLLALGVSALNQVQEYKEDALMERTKNRPVAAKRITPQDGMFISISLIVISFIFIYFTLDLIGVILFAFVLFAYNFLYTKAKKITIYAAVYGAVLGVIPPLIGWLSAKEDIFTLSFFSLAIFYFIWQIPHFWLLTLKYYKEYEKAQFPTIAKTLGIETLERVTFIWLLLTVIAGLFLVLSFEVTSIIVIVNILLIKIFVVFNIFRLLSTHNYLKNFIVINSYMLLLMLLLVLNALFIK